MNWATGALEAGIYTLYGSSKCAKIVTKHRGKSSTRGTGRSPVRSINS